MPPDCAPVASGYPGYFPLRRTSAPKKQQMKRRNFLLQAPLAGAGLVLMNQLPSSAREAVFGPAPRAEELYRLFSDPPDSYRPFVRWWWNGDKVEKAELARELALLRQAGIGGVEINPIKFPLTEDVTHTPALTWLSPAWIDMLDYALTEARGQGLIPDLIVGSGWPFGAEYLKGEDRSQVMVIVARKLSGPLHYETSLFDLFKEADPAISSPFPGREMKMISVHLVPSELDSLDQAKDLSDQIASGSVIVDLEEGSYYLYGLVKIEGFQEVINGAPGANGPVLNHYSAHAVAGFLDRMSGHIQERIGPLKGRIRSLFTDSLELEGANWCQDMETEFRRRRGYDLMAYLPFILFKIGSMGNTYDYRYGAAFSEALAGKLRRVRYDFDLTLAELLRERFYETFLAWCKQNGVQSRIQSYGRGYQPLEGSFGADIPECETWIQYGLGTEMSDTEPKKGRAYTVVNKFVSSAAHLEGKRLVSCEELTNIYMVFNTTLEIAKLAADQSIISGTTQPVFHGFGYSPREAPFPGWVRYGTFLNEKNPWWPYFRHFTDYKARLSALLQQGDQFGDIGLLAPVADLWSQYGAQNDPFPFTTYPDYQSLVWEAVHRNGNGCDYLSEAVIRGSTVDKGQLCYGPRKYHTLFLIKVSSLEPETAEQLSRFVDSGGRVFCLETYPDKAPGWQDYQKKDAEVVRWVEKMKATPGRFQRLDIPADHNFTGWFRELQQTHGITPYVRIQEPDPFVTQVRYSFPDMEGLFFINSDMARGRTLQITPSAAVVRRGHPWLWDAVSGKRYRLQSESGAITLELGPADSRMILFDRKGGGEAYSPPPAGGPGASTLSGWSAEFRHVDGTVKKMDLPSLKDVKDIESLKGFAGTIVYRTQLPGPGKDPARYLNLGKVSGVSEVLVNGSSLGVQWFGNRIYPLDKTITGAGGTLEVHVVTILGNYLKTLKDNVVGQYWTNEGRKVQPFQSMGLIGPVTVY